MSGRRGHAGWLHPPATVAGLLVVAAALLLLGVAPSVGQDAPDDLRPDANHGDVYLNDSLEAVDAIARARRLADQGEWREAAQLLQATADDAAEKVVRTGPGRYVSVRLYIAQLIADWPGAGLQAYRALYEEEAAAAAAGPSIAHDIHALQGVVERYFCTEAAAPLVDRIAQLAIEAGEFDVAHDVCAQLLEHHPDAERWEARCRSLQLIAETLAGQEPDVPAELAATPVTFAGVQQPLTDVLAALAVDAVDRPTTDAATWPCLGGDARRNRVGQCPAGDVGLLWRHDLQPAASTADDDRFDLEDALLGSSPTERVSVCPAADPERVYVQHRRQLWALARTTGATVWQYAPAPDTGVALDDFEQRSAQLFAPAVADGYLVAALPGEVTLYDTNPLRAAALVGVAADTGRLRWRVEPATLGMDAAEFSFDPAPLIARERVYVAGRRRRSFGFEDCFLLGFALRDGSLAFQTHLAGASVGTFGARPITLSIPASRGAMVYVCTNLGVMAAVNGSTGTIEWLTLYERSERSDLFRAIGQAGGLRAWHCNPVLVEDDRVVAAPLDGETVLVLDARTGAVTQTVGRAALGEAATLLGVHAGLLCTAGSQVCAYDLEKDELCWSAPLPERGELYGRAQWTAGELIVPTSQGLSRYNGTDGSATHFSWPSQQESGNLQGLADVLLVAGAKTVAAFVPKASLYAALQAQLAARPSDPAPAVELAEIALRGEELATSRAALAEAIQRIDAAGGEAPELLRARLFELALQLADAGARATPVGTPPGPAKPDAPSSDTPQPADELLLAAAARFAARPAEQVRYRFHFAELGAQRGLPAQAVQLYQQVLQDRSLAALPAPAPEQPAAATDALAAFRSPAAIEARQRVADLLAEHGRALYEPFEQEARQLFEQAVRTGDEAVLQRVTEVYAASTVAASAWLQLAEIRQARGDLADAARCLTIVYRRYADPAVEPGLLWRIAELELATNRPAHAYLWLTKGIRRYPQQRFGAQQQTFAERRAELSDVAQLLEPGRPTIAPPLTETYQRSYDGPAWLLAPRFAELPRASWSQYFVYERGQIRCFGGRDGRERWPTPAPVRTNPELVLALPEVAVFATQHEILGLNPATGARRWTVGEYPREQDNPDVDWEQASAFTRLATDGETLYAIRNDGLATAIDLRATGPNPVRWTAPLDPLPTGRCAAREGSLVYTAVQPGSAGDALDTDLPVTLFCIDTATGQLRDALPLAERESVERLLITLDGQVVVVTARSLALYDLTTRQRRWERRVRGRFAPAALRLDFDTLYFVPDGQRLEKLSLDDGQTILQSAELLHWRDSVLSLDLVDGSVILGTTRQASGLDALLGATLWHGTAPEPANFIRHFTAERYVVSLHLPTGGQPGPAQALFYDHRGGSGRLAKDGGLLSLGDLAPARAMLLMDGALVVQTGSVIRGWAEP